MWTFADKCMFLSSRKGNTSLEIGQKFEFFPFPLLNPSTLIANIWMKEIEKKKNQAKVTNKKVEGILSHTLR